MPDSDHTQPGSAAAGDPSLVYFSLEQAVLQADWPAVEAMLRHGRIRVNDTGRVLLAKWLPESAPLSVLVCYLEQGYAPNIAFFDNVTLLARAARNNRADMVQPLIDYGAELDFRDVVTHRTAVDWALDAGHEALAMAMLDRARMLCRASFGSMLRSAFSEAVRAGRLVFLEGLVARNVHGLIPLDQREQKLAEALRRGANGLSLCLIDLCESMNHYRDRVGDSLLGAACEGANVPVIEKLIARGGDIHHRNNLGESLFKKLAWWSGHGGIPDESANHVKIMRRAIHDCLLKHGADPSDPDPFLRLWNEAATRTDLSDADKADWVDRELKKLRDSIPGQRS
ncbi:MAG: ankyrin repeat domain-containing protein [Gammaproteobacteria bacterium]|nr:ankyrin repeat domain-containing protein [Gammaproteobacteria bacterium]